MNSISVFAPATVANVASGFDILGFAIHDLGDIITVSLSETLGVQIDMGSGSNLNIPTDPRKNTAGVPLLFLIDEYKPAFGFKVLIKKGIPLGSGLGGSAASAVGAALAGAKLIEHHSKIKGFKIAREKILGFALEGEAVASGSKHADNIAPCLYGGFTLSAPGHQPDVVSLPPLEGLFAVVVCPSIEIETKTARSILSREISLQNHIQQSSRLARLISGCYQNDHRLISQGLEDLVIEPQRAKLIPGFSRVKEAALQAGALGCSISGAGPSVFALFSEEAAAIRGKEAMVEIFKQEGLSAISHHSSINSDGARVQ